MTQLVLQSADWIFSCTASTTDVVCICSFSWKKEKNTSLPDIQPVVSTYFPSPGSSGPEKYPPDSNQ